MDSLRARHYLSWWEDDIFTFETFIVHVDFQNAITLNFWISGRRSDFSKLKSTRVEFCLLVYLKRVTLTKTLMIPISVICKAAPVAWKHTNQFNHARQYHHKSSVVSHSLNEEWSLASVTPPVSLTAERNSLSWVHCVRQYHHKNSVDSLSLNEE